MIVLVVIFTLALYFAVFVICKNEGFDITDNTEI